MKSLRHCSDRQVVAADDDARTRKLLEAIRSFCAEDAPFDCAVLIMCGDLTDCTRWSGQGKRITHKPGPDTVIPIIVIIIIRGIICLFCALVVYIVA